MDDFNWMNAKADGKVVVHGQAAIAIYENDNGNLVLRQEGHMHQDEDQFIYIQHSYLPTLIAALEQARLKKQRET